MKFFSGGRGFSQHFPSRSYLSTESNACASTRSHMLTLPSTCLLWSHLKSLPIHSLLQSPGRQAGRQASKPSKSSGGAQSSRRGQIQI